MQKSVLATLLCLTILRLEVTKGQGSLPDRAGDYIICDEDLDTLHGLLIASSNTFDAYCCNNGKTTNNITCGNGVDCSSVCDVTHTCAKVVIEPEEGQELCSTGDHYALGISTPCNSAGTTNCGIDAYGQDTPPDPNFCEQDTRFVKKADWQSGASCCICETCKFCDCCPTYEEMIDMLKGTTPSQSSPPTSPSQSSSVDIDIDWNRELSSVWNGVWSGPTICVPPGKIVQFNWDGDHNVEIIYPEDWASCNVTGIDNMTKTGPRNLGPAPWSYNVAITIGSYFFTSGVAGDCQHMKAKITVSNDCNATWCWGCCC